MIASRSNRRVGGSASAALLLLGLACASTAPSSDRVLLEPFMPVAARPPNDPDRAAAALAAAALAATTPETPALQRALAELSAAVSAKPREVSDADAAESKLLPLALDMVNATLDDPDAYRAASAELLDRGDLDPALRERLQRSVDDDPLEFARARIWDHRESQFAQTFNAVSRPLGTTLLTGLVLAPYQIATSAVHWLAGLFEGEKMSVQERQALAHRKQYLAEHADVAAAPALVRKVERADAELRRAQRDRDLEAAGQALEIGNPYLALSLTARALRQVPGDAAAKRLQGEALEATRRLRGLRRRSLEAPTTLPGDLVVAPEARLLAEALLAGEPDLVGPALALRAADHSGDLADEVDFVLALAQYEVGQEHESWDRLEELVYRDPVSSNMARHAAALVASSWRNPYGAFQSLAARGRGRRVAYQVFGPWAQGPRYRAPPAWLAYLIDAPALAQTVAMSPVRFALGGWRDRSDFQKGTAVAGYRYLERHPSGEFAPEVIAWLYDYEENRQNWAATLRLADFRPDFEPKRRRELAEKAAEQVLAAADRAERRDLRGSILRGVVREFPDSEAGQLAGEAAREELLRASAQRVRMTRAFLEENRDVAGPGGLGIRDALLDGRERNGELHPEGVTFLGARSLEFALLADSGDEDDPPVRIRRTVSAERLARCVALLDEATLRNARVDPDDDVGADARRDAYFERARLGLTEAPDVRPTAESTYVFQGIRERYGVVRGRESILPFDLVFQGSLADLTLGAFPRWRQPETTPDAFLYR